LNVIVINSARSLKPL